MIDNPNKTVVESPAISAEEKSEKERLGRICVGRITPEQWQRYIELSKLEEDPDDSED